MSLPGFVVDLRYEYMQDQPGGGVNGGGGGFSSSAPSLRHRLFLALDFVREQVWLTQPSSSVLHLARGLSHRGSRAVQLMLHLL